MILLIAVIAFVGLGAFFIFGLRGMCTNSDGQLKWYTEGGSCSYVNYESCSLTKKEIPSGTTAGCTDQQKITILQKDTINLTGVAAPDTFPETCREQLKMMYSSDPYYADQYERWLRGFNNWGVTRETIAAACKPFVSEALYQAAISDPRL